MYTDVIWLHGPKVWGHLCNSRACKCYVSWVSNRNPESRQLNATRPSNWGFIEGTEGTLILSLSPPPTPRAKTESVTRVSRPSGAVEGDWLRRGGWLTDWGLTLLVGDRFRLVSRLHHQIWINLSQSWEFAASGDDWRLIKYHRLVGELLIYWSYTSGTKNLWHRRVWEKKPGFVMTVDAKSLHVLDHPYTFQSPHSHSFIILASSLAGHKWKRESRNGR